MSEKEEAFEQGAAPISLKVRSLQLLPGSGSNPQCDR